MKRLSGDTTVQMYLDKWKNESSIGDSQLVQVVLSFMSFIWHFYLIPLPTFMAVNIGHAHAIDSDKWYFILHIERLIYKFQGIEVECRLIPQSKAVTHQAQ